MIAALSQHPEYVETVLRWLNNEWGISRSDAESFMSASDDRPGAILALADEFPIGVLAFKRHRSQFQLTEELWINAVYVEPQHRHQGIATELVNAAVDICSHKIAARLFVWTDVPELYLACGWQRLDVGTDTNMSTLACDT